MAKTLTEIIEELTDVMKDNSHIQKVTIETDITKIVIEKPEKDDK